MEEPLAPLPPSHPSGGQQELARRMPDRLRSEGPALGAFEIIVAANLDPPYRYAQEYYWLEILAEDPAAAVEVAGRWVSEQEGDFEVTDFWRKAGPHRSHVQTERRRDPIDVWWGMFVSDEMPPGWLLRHPITGLRIGFIAAEETERFWLPEQFLGDYRLITRKPVADSEPVCLTPIVSSAFRPD